MESNKIQEFIDRLAEKTARNELDWKRLTDYQPLIDDISLEISENLNIRNSFFLDTSKQRIFLLDYSGYFKVAIIDSSSKEKYIMSIEPTSYYRLESLITNSHQIRDKMLDDFLND